VPGIAYATALEDLDASGLPTGTVSLYCGDGNGRANAALLAKVRIASRGFRLAGQALSLYGTVPTLVSITLSFGVLDGYTTADVQAAARAAVVAAVNALGPGSYLDPSILGAALKTVPGVALLPAYPTGVVDPSATVVPASFATIFRTRLDLVGLA
jgi:hypothetical protein